MDGWLACTLSFCLGSRAGVIFLDGLEFYRSDHFGLLAYVDVDDADARDLREMRVARGRAEVFWYR